eukprot:9923701-Alexandrium_andersonii.AAC.1
MATGKGLWPAVTTGWSWYDCGQGSSSSLFQSSGWVSTSRQRASCGGATHMSRQLREASYLQWPGVGRAYK